MGFFCLFVFSCLLLYEVMYFLRCIDVLINVLIMFRIAFNNLEEELRLSHQDSVPIDLSSSSLLMLKLKKQFPGFISFWLLFLADTLFFSFQIYFTASSPPSLSHPSNCLFEAKEERMTSVMIKSYSHF